MTVQHVQCAESMLAPASLQSAIAKNATGATLRTMNDRKSRLARIIRFPDGKRNNTGQLKAFHLGSTPATVPRKMAKNIANTSWVWFIVRSLRSNSSSSLRTPLCALVHVTPAQRRPGLAAAAQSIKRGPRKINPGRHQTPAINAGHPDLARGNQSRLPHHPRLME